MSITISKAATEEYVKYETAMTQAKLAGEDVEKLHHRLVSRMSADAVKLLMQLNETDRGNRPPGAFHKPSEHTTILAEIEHTSIYHQSMEWALIVHSYLLERAKVPTMKASHTKVIKKFLAKAFGPGVDAFGNIYNQYYANAPSNIIPTEYAKYAAEFAPTAENWNNLMRQREATLPMARATASILTGLPYTSEHLIYIHGAFNTLEELDSYKAAHKANIRSLCYELPVGREILLDPFRENLENVDAEGAFRSLKSSQAASMKKMSSQLGQAGKQISSEDAKIIGDYQKQIRELRAQDKHDEAEVLQVDYERRLNDLIPPEAALLEENVIEAGRMTRRFRHTDV